MARQAASSPSRLRRYLASASPATFTLVATLAAFCGYFCMYAFRKPFAAGSFEGESVFGLQLKIAFVIAQVIGYAGSKVIAIKFVSELPRAHRARVLVGLIACAELSLLGLGALPPEGKVVAMFLNGLPLGAVWGLVFAFLEGRRTSELLGAGLSMSYVVASGAVKWVGREVVQMGVSEYWMPSLVGLMFLPPFLLCVYVLHSLPAPDPQDEAARSQRAPMDGAQRTAFFTAHLGGLLSLCGLYVLLTAYRDFRDNFAFELWGELGYGDAPEMMAYSELPIAVFVMLSLALIFRVSDNRRAFFLVHMMMGAGSLLIGLSTLLFMTGALSGALWMVVVGAGLYLGYVPFGCVLFDRLIAMTRSVGTAVFMINVTDALGYAGSVTLLLYRNFGSPELAYLDFFVILSLWTAGLCGLGFIASALYFSRLPRAQLTASDQPE